MAKNFSSGVRSIKNFSLVLISLLIGISCIVLLGWITGSPKLTNFDNQFYPMSIGSALSFILFSGILLLPHYPQKGSTNKWIMLAISIFIISYGIYIIIDFTTEASLLPNKILYDKLEMYSGISVVKISLLSGILFILSGLSGIGIFNGIFGNKKQVWFKLVSISGIIILMFGGIFFLAYLFTEPLLNEYNVVPLELPTSLAFFVLGGNITTISLAYNTSYKRWISSISDISISIQLQLGLSMIMLLVLLLGGLGWQHTQRMALGATSLYNNPLQVRRAIGELKTDIIGMRLEFRIFSLAEDDEGRKKALLNRDQYQANAEEQFNILYERYLGPRIDIENAHKAFKDWVDLREGNILLVREGKISEAQKRVERDGDVGSLMNLAVLQLIVIDEFAINKADELYEHVLDQKVSLNRQLFFLIVFIILLAVFIMYNLLKNINHPLKELGDTAQQIMDGNMKARCAYQSLNEFGILSNSFNDMAEIIETELELNEKTVKLAEVMLSENDAYGFSHNLLKALLDEIGGQMAALYLPNKEGKKFEAFVSIGMDREFCKSFSYTNFEGEFGAALATKKIQHITAIPDDTNFKFHAVSGTYKPREIITIPIVFGNEILAIISISTIKSFSGTNMRLLDNIQSTLSARTDGILAYRQVLNFSQQLEHQNNKLTDQNIELENQKKQLNDANQLKTNFLSNMSHELRTPLNSVIALSGVLSRRLAGKVSDDEYSYIDVIERNGKQLLTLINGILDLSRIESGCEDIEIKTFTINSLINEVIELIESQAIEKNIILDYISEIEQLNINSDYVKCRHIIQNIVSNAVKFTEKGHVQISTLMVSDYIYISVSDTGIGIKEEDLGYIFDEFRQADNSKSRKYGGTGLGLAIAHKYAILLGGDIEVESTENKGSKFTLCLPISNLELESEAITNPSITVHKSAKQNAIDKNIGLAKHTKNSSVSEEASKSDENKPTVLIVEDIPGNTLTLRALIDNRFKVIDVDNGIEGFELAKAHLPALILMDIALPDVDGISVLKKLRNEQATKHIPVIAISASAMKGDKEYFIGHGFTNYVAKPIDNLKFNKAIEAFLPKVH